MSKYVINDTTLTAIGDAVRAKGGTTELIPVSGLADAIINLPSGGGGGGDVEPIVLTGNCSYACVGSIATNYIEKYGDTISTNNIMAMNYMFEKSPLKKIPFEINCDNTTSYTLTYMFSESLLEEIPVINNVYPSSINRLFNDCHMLRTLPEDFGANWNWNEIHTNSSAGGSHIFFKCYSLRKVPDSFLSNLWGVSTSTSYAPMYNLFGYCYTLDEVKDFPIQQANLTTNRFAGMFDYTEKLKSFTFATNEDGSPKTATWKTQTIDLSKSCGHATNENDFIDYNSGITADKEVKDDATYQALKNDPDWFATKTDYSRYNHDSAVNTINSLPDCSAYLASAGGTNTIKFKGAAGALTDGGAINTLTEEEIAVAAARGWTVTLV